MVTECLEAVHEALSKGLIISTEFECVEYVVHWSGVVCWSETGSWPIVLVVRSASTL